MKCAPRESSYRKREGVRTAKKNDWTHQGIVVCWAGNEFKVGTDLAEAFKRAAFHFKKELEK
jgi:hypothetical protein